MRLRSLINVVGYISFVSTFLRCTPPEINGLQKTDDSGSPNLVSLRTPQLDAESSNIDIHLVDKLDMELDQDMLDQFTLADLSDLLDKR